MQHQHEVAVRLQREGHPIRRDVRRVPGRPVEKVSVRRHRRVGDQAFVTGFRIVLVEVPRCAGRIELHRRVMHDPRIAGSQLPRFDEPPRRDRHRNDEMAIDVVAAGAKRVGSGHGDDDVRRAEVPGAGRDGSGRHGAGVAFRHAAGDPPLNQRDLLVAQSLASPRTGRNLVPASRAACIGSWSRRDLLGVGAGVRIAQQTERRRSARPMARRAMLEDDRRDVFGESHGSGRGCGSWRGARLDGRRGRRRGSYPASR